MRKEVHLPIYEIVDKTCGQETPDIIGGEPHDTKRCSQPIHAMSDVSI